LSGVCGLWPSGLRGRVDGSVHPSTELDRSVQRYRIVTNPTLPVGV
jgi:hypothetical protein